MVILVMMEALEEVPGMKTNESRSSIFAICVPRTKQERQKRVKYITTNMYGVRLCIVVELEGTGVGRKEGRDADVATHSQCARRAREH